MSELVEQYSLEQTYSCCSCINFLLITSSPANMAKIPSNNKPWQKPLIKSWQRIYMNTIIPGLLSEFYNTAIFSDKMKGGGGGHKNEQQSSTMYSIYIDLCI